MPDIVPAERLEFETESGRDRLDLVGPSQRGWIYRSVDRPACYRVVPMPDAPLEFRAEAAAWKDRPRRPGLAPIVEATQDYDSGLFVIRYETQADGTLQDVGDELDPPARLELAARTVEAARGWWDQLGAGFLPMPADIVFTTGGTPVLLAAPGPGLLPLDGVFVEPSRARYLAPESLCGGDEVVPAALDRYALGVGLLRCFFRFSEPDPEGLLLQTATGEGFETEHLESALPMWLDAFDAIEEARSATRRLVDRDPSARTGLDLGKLADALRTAAQRVNPLAAVASTASARGPSAALELLKEMLLELDAPELLAQAGRLAMQTDRVLEAIEFFERAIALAPERALFEEQLAAVLALARTGPTVEQGGPPGLVERVDAILWRDYQRLTPRQQQDHEGAIARALLGWEDYGGAASFIYPRLFDGETYLWWKFDMTLAYTEALLGQGSLQEARDMLSDIKRKLAQVRQNRSVPEAEIARHGGRVTHIEGWLLRLRKPGARSPD